MWYQDNNNINVPLLPIEPIDDFAPSPGVGGSAPNDGQSEYIER